jgi:peptidoglycan/LPS O-acetylase OafA/YrhL
MGAGSAETGAGGFKLQMSQERSMHPYRNFILMIAVSATLMFGLMYSTNYQFSHVWFSETRLFMTFIMAGIMALVMLLFMLHMYKSKRANVAIVIGAVALMGLGLARSQITVDDVAWMKAMIPHHSIAILTSERANITDPRVRKLADEIIEAQRREIAEMEVLIRDLENK